MILEAYDGEDKVPDGPSLVTPEPTPGMEEVVSEEGQQEQQEPQGQDAINQVATEFGLPPEQFAGIESPEAARAYAKAMLNDIVQAGAGDPSVPDYSQATQQQYQQPQQQWQPEPINLEQLGLEDDSPAGKAIRALEKQVGLSQYAAIQVAQQVQALQEQSKRANYAQLQTRASEVVQGFQSPLFGSPGNRTPYQEWNVQRLYDTADSILIGAHRKGRPLPTVEQRLRQAKVLLEQESGPASFSPQTPTSQQKPSIPPTERQGAPQSSSKPMGLTDVWSENPQLMARIRGR